MGLYVCSVIKFFSVDIGMDSLCKIEEGKYMQYVFLCTQSQKGFMV
jgi:hypothetical protein